MSEAETSSAPLLDSRATASSEPRPPLLSVWIQAMRPKTLGAAFAPIAVATGLAAAEGQARPGIALIALLSAIAIQIGTNLFNDYEDFRRGADNEKRLGPARATQKGWLKPRQVLAGAISAFALALALGAVLVAVGGWPIVAIGLASLLCGFAYTGGPYPLAYLGIADAFVMFFFGNIAVCTTYYLQTQSSSWSVAIASVSVGALATAILVVNNLRDRSTDAEANKRTLAVRFGPGFARVEYALLVFGAYALLALVWASELGGIGWLLPWLSLPLAVTEYQAICNKDGADLNPHLGRTGRLCLVFSLLLALGVQL